MGAVFGQSSDDGEPARDFNWGMKEGSFVQNPVAIFGFENFWRMCLDYQMPTYGNNSTAWCGKCNMRANVNIETREAETSYSDRGTNYSPAQQRVTIDCDCGPRYLDSAAFNHTSKETKVTQQYETTPEKNTALISIVRSVKNTERTLFERQQAIELVQAEQTKRVTAASLELDRVLAEAIHAGVELEDLNIHDLEYQDELERRMMTIIETMSLANVLEGV